MLEVLLYFDCTLDVKIRESILVKSGEQSQESYFDFFGRQDACTKISCSSGFQGCRAGLWGRKLCYPLSNDNLNKPHNIGIYEFLLLGFLHY